VSAIASLAEDRVVEGVYAVARKERRRTKAGASYLALELVDPSGRIEARVWSDVELLDNRFAEGDAVHVLGRVEKFRDRLQLDVRSLEAAEADPAELAPAMRRDAAELDGFLEFLASEISHDGLRETVGRFLADEPLRAALRGCPPLRLTTPTPGVSSSTRSASPRSAARRRNCTRACGSICCWRPRSSTTSAARASWSAGRPSARPKKDGCSATSTSAYA
jgi:hypothetical protein